MRLRLRSLLCVGLLGLIGCSQSDSGPVDVTKIKAPDAEQQEAIKKFDTKINEEEFGSPMPGSKPATKKR